jgi:sporulation protein YlmC with PRC-barrel domain
MKMSDIVGKKIVDSAGNEIGKADELELDLKEGTFDAVVVKGKGSYITQLQSERLDSLLKKLRITKSEDLLIPVDDIQSVGEFVVLKKELRINPK